MDAPKLPQQGAITSFSFADGIGRIRLEDGTELKVGASGLKEVVSFDGEERPLVGVRVEVHTLAPHPLGGWRATKVTRVGKEISFERVSLPGQWENKLRAAGLSPEHAATLREAIRPAARLSLKKKGGCPTGGSKFGGVPDAPADFAWPTIDGRPLLFVAQLRLADLPASVTRDLELPPKGLLSFFFGAEAGTSGASLRARVVLFDAAEDLAPARAVDAEVLEPCAITAKEVWSPPPVETARAIFAGDEDAARICEAALMDFERAAGRTPAHRVGGHPQPVQCPMERRDERLLLQIDSDDACDLCWEDAGRLYFLFRRSAGIESARCEIQSG